MCQDDGGRQENRMETQELLPRTTSFCCENQVNEFCTCGFLYSSDFRFFLVGFYGFWEGFLRASLSSLYRLCLISTLTFFVPIIHLPLDITRLFFCFFAFVTSACQLAEKILVLLKYTYTPY